MLLATDASLAGSVQLAGEHLKRATELAARFRQEDLLHLLNRMALVYEDVRTMSSPTLILEAAMVELAKATLEEVAPAFLEIADAYGMAILLGRGPSIEIAVPAGGGAFRTVPLPEVAQSMAARSAGVSVQSLHIDEFDNTPPAARH